MTRTELGDSDLQNLDSSYRCRLQGLRETQANRAMRRTLHERSTRLREPARNPWPRPVRWLVVLVAGPGLWALLIGLAWWLT